MTIDLFKRNDRNLFLYLKSKRLFFGSMALILFLTTYWLWLDYKDFLRTPIQFEGSSQSLVLAKGTGLNSFARQMESRGIIKHRYFLKLLAHFKPEYKNLKAGEYQLDSEMTPDQLMIKLSSGQVIQYSFTIIEGQTALDIYNKLNLESRLRPVESKISQQLLPLLEINSISAEGWFYPETYYFSNNASAFSILKRASKKMRDVLALEWRQRASGLPYDSPYQALILASIIEKETGISSERTKIAGVFVRRLQKNMRLQTDPTVIYGIGPDFNGDITRRDLKTPTAYNTYVIKGLPPTPIAMPSREAIYAALHPDAGRALYFVADGSGGHYFSETLLEHQQAVRRMLKRTK